MKNLFLMILMAIVVISCQNQKPELYSEKITKDNLSTLIEKVKADKSFTSEDVQLFSTGVARLSILDSAVIDRTIGEIIESQKEFAKNQNTVGLAINLARYDMILKHKFAYINIVPKDTNGQKFDFVVFQVTNLSGKEVKNIEGSLQFYTPQNEMVKQYNIKSGLFMTKPLKSGDSVRLAAPFYHVDGNVRDSLMRAYPQMRAIWTPSRIEFTDGKEISVPMVK